MNTCHRRFNAVLFVCILAVSLWGCATALAAGTWFYAGNHIYFGQYEQDNDRLNGAEVIEWRVLDVDTYHNRALVISEYCLDGRRFDVSTYRGWENSELCRWLNTTFLNTAFTQNEQNAIYGMKVFLLSESEACDYFYDNNDRKAVPTKYAMAQGAYRSNNTGAGWWWLRTPSTNGKNAACITYAGVPHDYDVKKDSGSVRPAIWLDLSAFK